MYLSSGALAVIADDIQCSKLPLKLKDYMVDIEISVDSVVTIVSEMLNFEKIEAGGS